jgi:hypothetical protein
VQVCPCSSRANVTWPHNNLACILSNDAVLLVLAPPFTAPAPTRAATPAGSLFLTDQLGVLELSMLKSTSIQGYEGLRGPMA